MKSYTINEKGETVELHPKDFISLFSSDEDQEVYYNYQIEIVKDSIKDLENNPIKITQKTGTSSGKFWICSNKEQLEQIVDFLYQKQKKEADDFSEYTKNNVVYDGSVFGKTRSLLAKSKISNDVADKMLYLKNFGYVGDGNIFENVKKEGWYSKYPFIL